MKNKKVETVRLILKILGVVTAVFTLIGSIGCLAGGSKLAELFKAIPHRDCAHIAPPDFSASCTN